MDNKVKTCDVCGEIISPEQEHGILNLEVLKGERFLVRKNKDKDMCEDCLLELSSYLELMIKDPAHTKKNFKEILEKVSFKTEEVRDFGF